VLVGGARDDATKKQHSSSINVWKTIWLVDVVTLEPSWVDGHSSSSSPLLCHKMATTWQKRHHRSGLAIWPVADTPLNRIILDLHINRLCEFEFMY